MSNITVYEGLARLVKLTEDPTPVELLRRRGCSELAEAIEAVVQPLRAAFCVRGDPDLQLRCVLEAMGLQFGDCLQAFANDTSDGYVLAARDEAREGELEVDSRTVVSRGDDNGAYVLAWLWVSANDAARAEAAIAFGPNC